MISSSSIFLISPANMSGVRGARLLCETGTGDIHTRLKGEGVELGEVFTHVSSLYFRGKLEYGNAFGGTLSGSSGAYIITPNAGLMSPKTKVRLEELRAICNTEINAGNEQFCRPLESDIRRLREKCEGSRFVLLGSIATPKYVEPLMRVLEGDLFYPSAFAGLGDMSRGALLLQCVRTQVELDYTRYGPAARRNKRLVAARCPKIDTKPGPLRSKYHLPSD
jgi:hypothetical protein